MTKNGYCCPGSPLPGNGEIDRVIEIESSMILWSFNRRWLSYLEVLKRKPALSSSGKHTDVEIQTGNNWGNSLSAIGRPAEI